MKKTFIIFTLLLLMALSVPCSYANSEIPEGTITTETIFFEDGSYEVVETTEYPQTARALKKSGKSTVTYYNSHNVKQWSFTLSATFAYNGSTAKALSASKSYTVSSGWSCSSSSKEINGATATGKATFKKGTIKKNRTIKLTCSKNGKITAKKS